MAANQTSLLLYFNMTVHYQLIIVRFNTCSLPKSSDQFPFVCLDNLSSINVPQLSKISDAKNLISMNEKITYLQAARILREVMCKFMLNSRASAISKFKLIDQLNLFITIKFRSNTSLVGSNTQRALSTHQWNFQKSTPTFIPTKMSKL